MGIYEFAILGDVSSEQRQCLTTTLGKMVSEFDLEIGSEVQIYEAGELTDRNRASAFAAVYFGGSATTDIEAASLVFSESVPVIPVVDNLEQFSVSVPGFLRSTNGYCLKKKIQKWKNWRQ